MDSKHISLSIFLLASALALSNMLVGCAEGKSSPNFSCMDETQAGTGAYSHDIVGTWIEVESAAPAALHFEPDGTFSWYDVWTEYPTPESGDQVGVYHVTQNELVLWTEGGSRSEWISLDSGGLAILIDGVPALRFKKRICPKAGFDKTAKNRP